MSNQQNIVKLIKAISGQANVLTIPRVYLQLLNNKHRAALLLSQCVYWSDKSKDPGNWFWKTDSEWKTELGLTRGGLDTALKENEKYIETKIARVGPTPKSHYRINLDLLVSDISDLLETGKSDLPENSESTMHRLPSKISPKHPELSPDCKAILEAYVALLPNGDPADADGVEFESAKWLAEKGYTPAQLKETYDTMKAEAFWRGKRIKLKHLQARVPDYVRDTNPVDTRNLRSIV